MNTSHLFYLVEGIAIAFFTIMAVQNLWNRNNRLRIILGAVLTFWALQHLVTIIFTPSFIESSRYIGRLINIFDTTAEPTCVFLLMELSCPGWLTWRKVVWNEAPFIIIGVLGIATDNIIFYYLLIVFVICYGLYFFIATIHNIKKYNAFLRQNYSYDENLNLRWLYIVLGTFLALMFVYAVIMVFDTLWADLFYVCGSIIAWAGICYCIQRQESILLEMKAIEKEKEENKSDTPTMEIKESSLNLEKAIKKHVIDARLYLDPHLKLGDMAQKIGTNRTYLSRFFNDKLNTTFYDYVNSLRLAHATHLLAQSDQSIMTIAQMSGFNSYSTFRRTFLAKHSISPQEYRDKIKHKE